MRHILLVDDEPEILEGLALILKPLPDVTLHTACLASQALLAMERQPISLVIADIRMPGMNGIEMWEEIQRRSPHCRVIFLSGVRDFDNIYRVIQSPHARFLTKMEPEEKILSTVSDALSELDDQERRQRDQQLQALAAYLTAESGAPVQRAGEILALLRCFPHGVIVVCLALAHDWAMPYHEKQKALRCFYDALCAADDLPAPSFLPLQDAHALCLMPAPPDGAPDLPLMERLRLLCAELETGHGWTFRCACGKTAPSAEELYKAYHDFLAWRHWEHVPRTQVCAIEALPLEAPSSIQARRLQTDLRTLQGYVKLGQHEGFLSLVRDMLREPQSSDDRAALLDVYFSILALLYQQMDAMHDSDLRERIRQDRGFAPEDAAALPDARERLMTYCAQVFLQLFPSDPYAHPDVVESIQRYIRDHLADDLSLNALSQRFAMHPSYLSRIFRENAGYRLHEYISSLRMSSAAQLLRSSGMRVNEIARKVGYDSVHTFIRSFRKQFGCTPAEYRAKKEPLP